MGESTAKTPNVTRLLEAWSAGREEALDQLLPAVYGELRRIARGQLARERRGQTLQPTDLVHEAFVRLVDQRASWRNRVHFFGIAATCMRRVLADRARRRRAQKRPQIDPSIEIRNIERGAEPGLDWIIAVDETLDRIEKTDRRQARVAELKVFSDLENEEIAALLDVSVATVKREWKEAKPLLRAIRGEAPRDAR